MSAPLLDKITENLKPTKPLNDALLWGLMGLALTVGLICVLCIFGVRDAFVERPIPIAAVLKPLYFIGLSLLLLAQTARLSRPNGKMEGALTLLLGAHIGAGLLTLLVTLFTAPKGEFAHQMQMSFAHCIETIFIGGAVAFAALYGLWFRHCAPANQTLFGVLSFSAVASLMAGAYALHCNMDSPFYILVFYFGPIAILGAVGAILGKRLFRW